ncbi:CoA transferase [Alcaligenaceae bacterium]|nr:CoA transferase [Alcaligenaceae bacterium]
MSGPLVGVKIVDLTSVGMGPYATQILADMGADVIKVESAQGDLFRHTAPSVHPGMSAAYLQLNRNKRSIVLDLKLPADQAVLKTLLRDADILVSNIRAQAMRRLGLAYDDLKQDNPRLIYCGVYGFSEAGPYAGKPAFDDIIQAMSGVAGIQGRGEGREPAYVNSVIADKTTGLTAVYAMTMALYEREKSGLGQAIEVPMFETMVSFNLIEHMAGATFSGSDIPMGYERVLSPFRKPYRTLDGYIGLLPYTTEQWRRFFELSGHPEQAEQQRFMDPAQRAEHIGSMYELLATIVAQRTTQEWMQLLESADIPMAPIASLEDLLDDPHLQAIGFFETHEHPTEGPVTMPGIPVSFSRTPGSIRWLAPTLDQDGAAIRDQSKT